MMNCTDINTQLNDYLDDQLTPELKLAFDQHLSTCSSCRKLVNDSLDLNSKLANIDDIPGPRSNFEERVFTKVRQQYPVERGTPTRFIAGFSTAVAASLAIWLTSTVLITDPAIESHNMISISVNEIKTIKLMIDAQSAFENVDLSINVPEHMQIDGYPGYQQLSWKTNLQKGSNILELPLMAVEHGKGELIAQIKYGDKTQTFRVELTTNDNGAMQYQLKEVISV